MLYDFKVKDIKGNEVSLKKYEGNRVILMAGGLGTRLRPLTEDTPKPMLKVGNKPILETIIKNFASHGFVNITISLNYKGDIIKDYFKDGSDFGVNIDYIEENSRLGTAGALSLLKDKPNEPFFVMNGDLLTDVNFSNSFYKGEKHIRKRLSHEIVASCGSRFFYYLLV